VTFGGAAEKAPKKSRKASAGQKELIPLTGRKRAKETATKKPTAKLQQKSA
jgi:DNA end-binding protein Ku